MKRSIDQLLDHNSIRWNLSRFLPFVCLALGGLCVSTYVLMYPQHFAESCEFSVETRELRVVNFSHLFGANLAWLVPAIPLFFLGRKRYVRIVYYVVSISFLLLALSIVVEDLTGYVNCYKRLGTGGMVLGLLQLLQAVILLLFSFAVGITALIRRVLDRPGVTAP